jgi:outer membrane immunogenic protein
MENQMKKIQLAMITASIIGMSATAVNAQSKFEGAYGQLGIGYESASPSTSTNVNVGGINVPTSVNIGNTNSFAGTATLGYTFAVTKDFLLGIGGEYSPLSGEKQNISVSLLGQTLPAGTFQKKNSYNFFVAPGLAVGTDGLAYAKLGYTGASFNTGGDTTNYTGYSLGLGYKHIIRNGFYGFGEVNYASYGNKSFSQSSLIEGVPVNVSISSNVNTMNLLVGVGYKF